MTETSDHGAEGGDTAANEAGAARVNLPAVVAPKLSAADDQAENSAADEAEQTKTATAPARSKRFIALAASVAFAAGFGSFVGSVSGSGLARFIYPPPTPPAPASGVENTIAAVREIKLELAQVAALKASLDSTARNTIGQYTRIAERLDRLDQRSAAAAETTASLPAATPAFSLADYREVPAVAERKHMTRPAPRKMGVDDVENLVLKAVVPAAILVGDVVDVFGPAKGFAELVDLGCVLVVAAGRFFEATNTIIARADAGKRDHCFVGLSFYEPDAKTIVFEQHFGPENR